MNEDKIGAFIAALRKAKCMTQSELARLLSVSNKTVSKWECGDGYPDITIVPKIAGIFSVTSDELLQGERSGEDLAPAERKTEGLVPAEPALEKPQSGLCVKILRAFFYVLTALPLIVTVIAIPFFPALIPAHYDSAWTVTRWGSKYENFIFPAIIIACAVLFYFLIRYSLKEHKTIKKKPWWMSKPEISLWAIFVGAQLLFNVLHYWFLIKAYGISTERYGLPEINMYQVEALYIGLTAAVIGALLPVTPMNPVFGIRTSTAMKNAEAWRKSHFWGGLTFLFPGVVSVITALIFTKGITSLIISATAAGIAFVLVIIEQIILSIKAKIKEKDKEKGLPHEP